MPLPPIPVETRVQNSLGGQFTALIHFSLSAIVLTMIASTFFLFSLLFLVSSLNHLKLAT
jgi:hypothetical protein